MAICCKQCGAALTERDAFCTKCGASRSVVSEVAAASRFCTKCGAALAGETKFCTKCGATNVPLGAAASAGTAGASAPNFSAAAGNPSQVASSGTATAKSPAGIPKIALVIGGVVVLVVIVVVVAGVIGAVHRARERAQAMEAAEKFEKNLAKLASSGNTAASNGSVSSAADINKAVNGLAAAANAFAQNAQKQGGTNSLNTVAGIAAAVSGAAAASNSNGSSNPTNTNAAVNRGQTQNRYSALEEVQQRVGGLDRDAPDSKTQAALSPLETRLDQLNAAVEGNKISSEDLNKSLAEISAAAAKLTPAILAATDAALTPPPIPSGPSMVPVAGTGNPKHDWPLEYERTVGGPEADLVVRTGDINNLGFGWPKGFDPFSGQSTPIHPWPDINHIPPQVPPGTDRIMLGTGLTAVHMHLQHTAGKLDRVMLDSVTTASRGDGYSGAMNTCYQIEDSAFGNILNKLANHVQLSQNEEDALWVPTELAADCTRERQLTMPTPIVLDVGKLPRKINGVVVQIFADDFQPMRFHSHFQVSINGTRIPTFEYAINALDQTGPIGKLLTLKLLPEYWPLLKSGEVKLLIDDPTTHIGDGYAVDFVRILVNPHKLKYQVSLTATVTDADTHKPITGATVSAGLSSAATDKAGKCELKGIPAGLVVAMADAPGYDEGSVPVDLPAGQTGHADIALHRHQESTAALEQSIAQTGTATIYGIHFDTGSPKFRLDSLPALQAVLGLINGRPGSNWIIAGHTDNQGSDKINIPLSKARAGSVIAWLTTHGIAANRLEPQGFGSTRPVADNSTANGRFLNRRVEVSLAK